MNVVLSYSLLLCCIFDLIVAYYQDAEIDELRKQRIQSAADSCSRTFGSSGRPFLTCVDSEIWGSESPPRGDAYHEVVRNFSCSVEDGGTPALYQVNATVDVTYNPCFRKGDTLNIHPEFEYRGEGYLSAGDDLFVENGLSAREAARLCAERSGCTGFTFQAAHVDGPAHVYFKSDIDKRLNPKSGWHTFRKKLAESCPVISPEHEEFRVDVFRETPFVALIRNFAKPSECAALMKAGGERAKMKMAFTKGGQHNPYRRSYSANIYPNLRDEQDPLTRFQAKMFALTRNMTGYAVYPPGQEPINAVLYREAGDEYRPHCDGTCNGAGYWPAERVATTILYCQMADEGGHTSFTSGALKLKPNEGDVLLFSYLLESGNMAGVEVEHSGCPIRKGTKWVATQWYRERVHADWNWEAANKAKREREAR